MNEQKYPNRLRDFRLDRWLTQRQLALKAKVALRIITDIEAGLAVPRASTKRKLLRALDLEIADHRLVWPGG